MEQIQNSINDLKTTGWTESQINELLLSFSAHNPEDVRTNITSLFHFFAIQTPENKTDYQTSFSNEEYRNFLHLLNSLYSGLKK